MLRIAAGAYPHWDRAFADQLVDAFRLPVKRMIKKFSRGQLSAIGIVIGLASRAPITFCDEPYLGLDAVARRTSYDRLLADFSEHPRTAVLSTHHIDEVANLLEHVVILDQGGCCSTPTPTSCTWAPAASTSASASSTWSTPAWATGGRRSFRPSC